MPPRVRSLLEDDATFPLLQRDCAERFMATLTTLRHFSPTPDWDDSPVVKLLYTDNLAALALSQAEADESLARMLLEFCGTSGVGGHRPRNSGALRRLFGSWLLGDVVAPVLKSAALSDTQCLCLDYDVNFTVFFRMHSNL